MENSEEKKYLKKCFKSYLMGKKLYDTNDGKAFEYFKQSQMGEKGANFLCDAAYSMKQKGLGGLGLSLG